MTLTDAEASVRTEARGDALPGPRRPWLTSLLLSFVFWTGFGLLAAVYYQWLEARPEELKVTYLRMAAFVVPAFWVWFPVTPLIGFLGSRWPLLERLRLRHLLFHLATCLTTVGLVHLASTAWYLLAAPVPRPLPSYTALLRGTIAQAFANDSLVYLGILGGSYALTYQRELRQRELRAARLEAQLAQAQMQALKMQLQPHFLFNTLNALEALVLHRHTERALDMLHRLAAFLRMTLDDPGAEAIPLRQELAFAEQYLAIEKIRFPDRLEVHLEIAPEALDAKVPNLLLQPLLENAVRHGVARSETGGRLEIQARRSGDRLELELRDTGPGLVAPTPARPGSDDARNRGIGLANVESRLSNHYGRDFEMILENAPSSGARVRLSLPFEAADESPVQEVGACICAL